MRLETKTDSVALYADDGTQVAWGNREIVEYVERQEAALAAACSEIAGLREENDHLLQCHAPDELVRLTDALAAAREENERLRAVIAGFNPRVDAADFDQLAEVGRSIEASRKRMGEIQERLALRSSADDAGRVERVLRHGLEGMAEADCAYGDNCPETSRHGTCTGCKARAVLAAADGKKEGE